MFDDVILSHQWLEADFRLNPPQVAVFVDGETEEFAPQANSPQPTIQAVSTSDRSQNELRPITLDEMVGQERLKPLLRDLIDHAQATGRPLGHMLLVGPGGTGKTTVAHIVANELGRRVFQVDAPLSHDMLDEFRQTMNDGDILFVDEIHRQVAGDRRGAQAAVQPEIFYHVLEDRVLATARGVVPFPEITMIGATTDSGLLPEPFLMRFPLQPRLAPYTEEEMAELARRNAEALGIGIDEESCLVFGRASRSVPRVVNNYIKSARMLRDDPIDRAFAERVVVELNECTLDGLTLDMQNMLTFLLVSGRREKRDGEVVYQASVNSIATALGKSRDTKAVSLYVEPELIRRGYVMVGHGGRLLTEKGVERARQLEG